MLVCLVATPFFFCYDLLCSRKEVHINLAKLNEPAETILDFYQGSRNDRGVTLNEIWKWDDQTLEARHDFIQWLFPLKEKGVNPTAPTTNEGIIRAFKLYPPLKRKMVKSLEEMLKFYGFELKANKEIVQGADFAKKSKNWLHPNNHNHLRITRILKSLKLHGLGEYSKSFLQALEKIYREHPGKITSTSFSYWQEVGN